MTEEPRIYDGAKNIWWRGQFSIKGAGNWHPHAKEYFLPYTKINLQWIKGLNVQPETIKFLEENIGSKLLILGVVKNFSGFDTKNKGTKAKIYKWDYIKQ